MKNILVLGGFGFIGTNLLKQIDKYYQPDYSAIIFDKIERHPYGVKCDCVKKVYAGDFSDENCINAIFNDNKIDIVVHLLSSTVPLSSNNAQYDVESNLIATLKLFSVMLKHNVTDIVYMSSGGAIYGDLLMKVHNEEDAVYPKSSYGIVKLAIEKYLLSYSELYGFHSLILRMSNPYGPYHYKSNQGVINVAIRKALKNQKFQIWGNGDGVKDYIYIEDACSIIMKLISEGVETNVYNLAASKALSVNEIVGSIRKIIPSFDVEYIDALSQDVSSFELDMTKLRKHMGGLKMTGFEDALKKTIDWQKENMIKNDTNF